MNYIFKHKKVLLLSLIIVLLSLIFIDKLRELYLLLGSKIDTNKNSFKAAFFILVISLFFIYTYFFRIRFIHDLKSNFFVFTLLYFYCLFRVIFPEYICFINLYDGIKYGDIVFLFAFLHSLNLVFVNWRFFKKKNKSSPNIFFNHDTLFVSNEIDNEQILNKLLETIKDFKPDTAFAIGINAIWGYGKSSFLERFRVKYVEENKNEIIFWNRIWKNKGSSAIIENFFEELKFNLSKYSSDVSQDINNYVNSILSLSDSDLKKYVSLGKNFLEDNSTLEQYYVSINETIKKIDKQVIILLDDLDRLEQEEILNTLKLIRTLSDFNNVIFIAGYDRKYVVDIIQSSKNNYLDKIFNVEINLLPFEERLVVDELMRLVQASFPKNLKSDDTPNYYDAFDNLFKNSNLNYENFLSSYRDVKRFINEFKFNSSFIESPSDIIIEEYIMLKLLTYKYRELNMSFFNNLNNYLTKGYIDEVNDKIVRANNPSSQIFLFDEESHEKLEVIIKNYDAIDKQVIINSLKSLFGEKKVEYYKKNQNSISKIYFTDLYVRNNIFIGKISITELKYSYENNEIFDLVTNYLQDSFSIHSIFEFKNFIFNNNPKNTFQFLDSLRTLNLIIQTPLFSDNIKVVKLIENSFNNLYEKDKIYFLEDIKKLLINNPKGYLFDFFGEIQMAHIRSKSSLSYELNTEIINGTSFFISDVLNILLTKLTYDHKINLSPDDLYQEYLFIREAIILDRKIILSPYANEIIKTDIKNRFIEYTNSKVFKSFNEKIDDVEGEFVGYSPNIFLGQIFSNPKTLQKLVKNPTIELYEKFYFEGWIQFNDFLVSLNENDLLKLGMKKEDFDFMKKFTVEYIKNDCKPLTKIQYDAIYNDLPF